MQKCALNAKVCFTYLTDTGNINSIFLKIYFNASCLRPVTVSLSLGCWTVFSLKVCLYWCVENRPIILITFLACIHLHNFF